MVDIAAIKARLSDPCEVASLLGLRVEQRIRNGVLCRCPVHNNKSGSLRLHIKRGALKMNCFGCGIYGDAIDLLAAIEGDRKKGLDRAATLVGAPLAAPRQTFEEVERCDPAAYHELAERILDAGRLDGRRWVRDVEAYLGGRRLLDLARADGWSRLPSLRWLVDLAGGDRELLVKARLARFDDRGQLRASWGDHRLVIPWRGPDGRVVALQRRRVVDADGPKYVLPWAPEWPYGSDVFKNIPCAETCALVNNIDSLQAREEQDHVQNAKKIFRQVAIVEGAVDTLAMRALYPAFAVLGIPGIGGWRASWAELVGGCSWRICLDRGKPGKDGVVPEDRAAARIALDLVGRRGDDPTPDRCSLCGALEAWLCGACGRRRAPAGLDWGKLWETQALGVESRGAAVAGGRARSAG